MPFVTKRHLSRRTFLRGAGVSLALPLLDSMIPAATLLGQTAARPRTRLGCIYVPHGAIMSKWTPATEGTLVVTSEGCTKIEAPMMVPITSAVAWGRRMARWSSAM